MQSTAGATTEAGEPQPCGSIGATVWFTYTSGTDQNVQFNTVGSDFNTVLAVYTGSSLTNLKTIACNDDDVTAPPDKSVVNFFMRAGVTYRIQAGGASGGSGSLTLNVGSVAAKTGVPTLMNYQGRLTNPTTGNPVPDGNYSTTFRIFDAATGGTQQWTETQKVAVSGGLFNVLLGTNTALTPSVFNGRTRFLEVQVTGDPAMTPRQRLASVPYALVADRLVAPDSQTFFESGGTGWTSSTALTTYQDMGINTDGPDGNSVLYFYDAGNPNDEFLRWTDANDRFESSSLIVNISDRNAKANFQPIDRLELLDRLADVPIESWRYKQEDPSMRHIGPTAQDFNEAFGLGVPNDTYISPVDTDGVALASIQALYERAQEQDSHIDALEARLTALEDGTGGAGPAQAANASSGGDGWVLLTVVPLSVLLGLALAGLLGGWALARRRA